MIGSSIKPKKCKAKGCGVVFAPVRSMQSVCSPVCGLTLARAKREAEESKKLKESRAKDRERREGMKRRGEWIAEAQQAFNKMRRLEELLKGEGCISCGRSQAEVIATDGWKPGGAWDCGHYLSVGARPNLRFERDNTALQCKSCNAGSGKYAKKAATVQQAYRMNLIPKIGLARLEELEEDHTPRHWSIQDLKELRDECRRKARELESQRETESA